MDDDKKRRLLELLGLEKQGRPDPVRLREVAPILSPRLAERALEIVEDDPYVDRQSWITAALGDRLDDDRRAVAYRRVFFRLGDDPARAPHALARLAPSMPSSVQDDALQAARDLFEGRWRGQALAALAPHLDHDRLRRAIEGIATIEDPTDLAAGIVAISPSVPDDLLATLDEPLLRLAAADPALHRIAVQARDTRWSRVPDRAAELRKLLDAMPDTSRGALAERLDPVLVPPVDPAATVPEDPIELTAGLDGAEVEQTLEQGLDEFRIRFGRQVPANGGGHRRMVPKNGGAHHADPTPAAGGGAPDPNPTPTPLAIPPQPPAPYVGFTDPQDPSRSVMDATLRCDAAYWFWFTISIDRPAGATDKTPAPLPPLPEGTLLQVVVFGYDDEIDLPPGGLSGAVRLRQDGTSAVDKQPAGAGDLPAERRDSVLFFPVRTPKAPGTYRVRSSIYHQQNLLQSRVTTIRVTAAAETDPAALGTDVDYAISWSLDRAQLDGLGEQTLCLMLNQNATDSHGLRFVGREEFLASSTVGEGSLKSEVALARQALRQAAWDSPEPWDESRFKYAYDKRSAAGQGAPVDPTRLLADLPKLARAGFRLYKALCDTLAGERPGQVQQDDPSDRLRDLMRTPGSVHVALRAGAQHVLPAALFYDQFIDTQKDLTVCDEFRDALGRSKPIADSACFKGECPNRAKRTVVCPSNFWGYRHRLGLPVNVMQGDDAPITVSKARKVNLAMFVSDDFDDVYPAHKRELEQLGADAITLTDDRDQALAKLESDDYQIVYFFCHGTTTPTDPPQPALLLRRDGLAIDATNLDPIRWKAPRAQPLVVMNGCHTATHDPETLLGFVNELVRTCKAAGVIGTEITIFPSLARHFANELLGAFLAGQPLGEAVRQARLALLHKHKNPLGLVYIPYACNGLRLRA